MEETTQTSTLIHGSEAISQRLKYCLSPMGHLFKFDQQPPYKPKPLTVSVVLMLSSTVFALFILDFVFLKSFINSADADHSFSLIYESPFVWQVVRFYELYRISLFVVVILISIGQHGLMVNVIALRNNFINEKEQTQLANMSFRVFFIKSLLSCTTLVTILLFGGFKMESRATQTSYSILSVMLLFLLSITVSGPLMFTCFLGASLAKHVENFSKLHIDSMFDQFMKHLKSEECLAGGEGQLPTRCHQLVDSASEPSSPLAVLRRWALSVWCATSRLILRLKLAGAFLNSRKYPELPEMKMTKLSATTNLQLSDSVRAQNSRLVRAKLRESQIMLSELRDMVSDINKTSSAIIMMQIIYDTMLIILISTSSIQCKVYKSVGILILPTVASVVGSTISTVFVCTSLDGTPSQLKLMINKLFDFIIMTHGARASSVGPSGAGPTSGQDESLSETWSQFQYTRKLANTIQFSMGGILPVSRRLVFSILGHILSAAFIAIEIKSIVDTLGSKREPPAGGAGPQTLSPLALGGLASAPT